jgi:acetyl esterase/lipase
MPPFATFETSILNGVSGEWVRGKERDGIAIAPGRAFLYLHGGGYIACSPRTHRSITARLAKYAKCDVFAADYRLAPEHPFPAALEDALNAYRGLLDSGYAPGQIIIGGDSAGGNLAMATLLAIKKEKLPMPAAGVGISPWVNLSHPMGTRLSNQRDDPMLPAGRLAELARVVLAGEDPYSPLASPVLADLKGLPPLLLHVGSTEIILDDVKLIAERAKRDGVEITLRIFEKTPHVVHAFAPYVPEGKYALNEVVEFCEKRFSYSAGSMKSKKKGPM